MRNERGEVSAGCIVGCGALLLLGVLLAALVIYPISFYNQVITQREAVDNAWAQVQVQLQRRMDLIPNLVETVRGFAEQERAIFDRVSQARERLSGAIKGGAPTDEQAEAATELEGALGRLLALAEDNPEIRSNENFMALQGELASIEAQLATTRAEYNRRVRDYNRTIRLFPGNVIAGFLGFEPQSYFKAAPGAEEVPGVDF